MNGLQLSSWLERRLTGRGLRVQRGGGEAQAYFGFCDRVEPGAAAVMLDWGDAGIDVLFRSEQPSVSESLEEFAHVLQALGKRYRELPIREMRVRCELEVHECLDQNGRRLELPDVERAETRKLLEQDRRELAAVLRESF